MVRRVEDEAWASVYGQGKCGGDDGAMPASCAQPQLQFEGGRRWVACNTRVSDSSVRIS